MSDSMESVNPLLQIDTGFRSYLNAYTRSFQNHVVDGQLDYAFDSDFAVRQKIAGLTRLGKACKGCKFGGHFRRSKAFVCEMQSGWSAEIS